MKKIILILDGLGDIPYKQLKNQTPLGYAKTPNLDFLAKNSKIGLLQPIKNIAPESGAAQYSILGQPLSKFPGRGILEALGAGIKIKKNTVYLRCNFAKIKNKTIVHIREPIPDKSIIKKINKIDPDIKITPTIGYRAVMSVKNASPNISNTHPGYRRYKHISEAITSKGKELRCKGHKQTANKINTFLEKLEKLLKDKTLLIRGAGNKIPKLPALKNWALIADMPVEIGLAKMLNMKILDRKKDEIQQIIQYPKNIYVQIKAVDTYGHKGDLKGKIKAIEKLDKELKPLTKLKNTILCITADHSTPCKLKRHSHHPVPLLIFNGKDKDNIPKFSEIECKKGSLKTIEGKNLMRYLK